MVVLTYWFIEAWADNKLETAINNKSNKIHQGFDLDKAAIEMQLAKPWSKKNE